MQNVYDILMPLLKIAAVIIGIAVGFSFVIIITDRYSDKRFRKRLKKGEPAWLNVENEAQSGWYVVKKRDGDTVELIRLALDNTKKNIDFIPTDVTCNIEQLHKYDRRKK
jgi:lipopolysaccharide export LptBFGC system permease protein LptF